LTLRPGQAVRADLTEQAAAEFVHRHGRGAVAILRERAETAEELGHRIAATAWRELADAATRMIGVKDAGLELPRPSAPVTLHRGSAG
jgi:DeoR/GlpR family transcriptional regulator of sugar metabolism